MSMRVNLPVVLDLNKLWGCVIKATSWQAFIISSIVYRPEEQFDKPSLLSRSSCPELSSKSNFLIAFLRHVGCPFAERDVKNLVVCAKENPDVRVFVVSHGARQATNEWLVKIGGAEGLAVIIDKQRELYAEWGLGDSNVLHFLGLRSLLGVVRLWFSGIFNRSASGTRWQRSGIFLIKNGQISWRFIPKTENEFSLPDM